jgi:glycolate oxidase iron-sulfur subunit
VSDPTRIAAGSDEHGTATSIGHGQTLAELTNACVHCGFCLPACPTYALDGDENDSPRGRIHLAAQVAAGVAELDADVAGHFDACLGCLACVPACPSGVRYDRIIEQVRPMVEQAPYGRHRQRGIRALIFGLFPHPGRLRLAALGGVLYRRTGLRALVRGAGLLRRFPKLDALDRLMPAVTAKGAYRRVPELTQGTAPVRASVLLLTGCVQQVFFGDVNAATLRVLAADGVTVVAPRKQSCCGALSLHAGRVEEARRYARALIDDFEAAGLASADGVVVNVAGCGSTLKEYGELLADDPRYARRAAAFAATVRDVTELLAELGPRAPRHPLPARVAYHDACHLAHGQGVRRQPRDVLRAIPELELVEPAESGFCCGSAGIYNLVQPANAGELGRRKANRLRETGAGAVVTGNPGCQLQIQRHLGETGAALPVLHPVQVVDAAITGEQAW